jgi:hypothetical protein
MGRPRGDNRFGFCRARISHCCSHHWSRTWCVCGRARDATRSSDCAGQSNQAMHGCSGIDYQQRERYDLMLLRDLSTATPQQHGSLSSQKAKHARDCYWSVGHSEVLQYDYCSLESLIDALFLIHLPYHSTPNAGSRTAIKANKSQGIDKCILSPYPI